MDKSIEAIIPIFAIIFTFGIPGLIIFWAIYIKHKERMRLIDSGLTPDEVKKFFTNTVIRNASPYKGLKWGILLSFLGAGIIVGTLMYEVFKLSDGYTFGVVVLFIGLGFLTYYSVIKNKPGFIPTENISKEN